MFESGLQRKSRLMSAAERNFYELLATSLGEEYAVFAKVRMLDVVETSPGVTWMKTKKIQRVLADNFLDFVVCKKLDMSIYGVVELEKFNEKDGKKADRGREAIVAEACREAKLKMYYFDIRQDYKGIDLRRLITGRAAPKVAAAVSTATHKSRLTVDGSSVSEYSKFRTCPKCNNEVVTKVAVKGEHIGEKFLMCRKYPYCDYQVPLRDAKVQKLHTEKMIEDAKPGFKDWSAG